MVMSLAGLFLASGPATGQTGFLNGPGRAVSGAEIAMEDPAGSEVRLKLAGLTAPPDGALCPSTGNNLPDWECGRGSRLALESAISGETLECRLFGPTVEDRINAECMAQTRNLNAWMLATGWAILLPEWRGRNPEWDAAELAARRAQSMLWSGLGQ